MAGKAASLIVLGAVLCALLACRPVAEGGPDSGQVTPSPGPATAETAPAADPRMETATLLFEPTQEMPDDRVAVKTPTSSPTPATSEQDSTAQATALPPTEAPAIDEGAQYLDPPDRDLLELARSLILKQKEPIPHAASRGTGLKAIGGTEDFFALDLPNMRLHSVRATLRAVSPHAYWYVEDGIGVSDEDLERVTDVFEEEIYPLVTSDFGAEWSPGIDGDPRITILHVRLTGLAGYFSSMDEHPASAFPFSNEREMVYMDGNERFFGTPMYLSVLAHELQHLVHWNADPSEDTWVSEGLSELASHKAGYEPASVRAFLGNPTTSLVNWPSNPGPAHYGGDYLFFRYLYDRFGSPLRLVQNPLDGVAGVDSYLGEVGAGRTFRDVFGDWTVANLLDEPGDGLYSYPNAELRVRDIEELGSSDGVSSTIPQYSARYYSIEDVDEGLIIQFQGQSHTPVIPVDLVEGSCWWGNRGDSISTTLTRNVDLTQVADATLSYRLWYEIEEGWDYAYVEVSADDGSTWDILNAEGTSDIDTLGVSFGPGYTGSSEGWKVYEASLEEYAGQGVMVRFHYVTDDALHETGICVDHIAVPELDISPDSSFDGSWVPQGFRRIDNRAPQEYIVQIVEAGSANVVRELRLNSDNVGQVVVSPTRGLEKVYVIVAALAFDTMQEAPYSLSIREGGSISASEAYGGGTS